MNNLKNTMIAAAAAALITVPSFAVAGSCGSTEAHAEAGDEHAKTIVALAEDAGFGTLVAAVRAAGLADILSGEGPFTVFAPTDEAFAKLPEGTVEALLADPAALKQILLYHVVSGTVLASDVMKLESAKTLNGGTVAINSEDGVKINMSNVIKADIKASNGVVHVIDTVLIPAAS